MKHERSVFEVARGSSHSGGEARRSRRRAGGRLLVRTTSAPVDDQANVAVCKLVAEHLGVRVRRVQIASGHRSRDKVLRISLNCND